MLFSSGTDSLKQVFCHQLANHWTSFLIFEHLLGQWVHWSGLCIVLNCWNAASFIHQGPPWVWTDKQLHCISYMAHCCWQQCETETHVQPSQMSPTLLPKIPCMTNVTSNLHGLPGIHITSMLILRELMTYRLHPILIHNFCPLHTCSRAWPAASEKLEEISKVWWFSCQPIDLYLLQQAWMLSNKSLMISIPNISLLVATSPLFNTQPARGR